MKEKLKPAILTFRITLTKPMADVVYGLQEGKGNDYVTVQQQRSDGSDMVFCFSAPYRIEGDRVIVLGPFAQGPPLERFVYIDIGAMAGQAGSCWSRRLKIPLTGIEAVTVVQLSEPESMLATSIPGRGKDGGPNCATVKPFPGWEPASPGQGSGA